MSPDCILTDNVNKVFESLLLHGVEIAFGKWVRLTAADVDLLYSKNRATRGRSTLDGLVDDLFSQDWSLCALAREAKPASPVPLHDLLRSIKGPSDPFKAESSHLRRALGATNKIQNFIHTSDDQSASEYEAPLLFDKHELQSALSSKIVLTALPHYPGAKLQKFNTGLRTINSLKMLIARRVIRSDENRLFTAIKAEAQILESVVDQVAAASLARQFVQLQISSVASITSKDPKALSCLERLIQISLRDRPIISSRISDQRSIADEIRDIGIGLSPWELLTLRCEELAA